MKMKQVQIDRDLFIALMNFFNQDPNQIRHGLETELLKEQLNEKFQKIINNILFTKYKKAATTEERAAAIKEYIDNKENY